jgi:hypothetical protein
VPGPQYSDARALERILGTPHLAQAVPRLQPELLHRVIQHVGLEECGELVALATPEQLTRVFDLDLWKSAQAGRDEEFDAGRFGAWLQVLLEAGADVAAGKLAALPLDAVTAGMAQHVRVFDAATVTPHMTFDGELAGGRPEEHAVAVQIGVYRIEARRPDAWAALVEVLVALEAAHADAFQRLLTRCRAVSNSRPEESAMHDLLDGPEQAMFDLAFDRERRREQQGYVTPAQARAFLEMARRRAGTEAERSDNPIARAYFRSLDEPVAPEPAAGESTVAADGVAAVVEVLLESGMLEAPPRGLLEGSSGAAPRLARIHAALRAVFEHDPAVYARRSAELGYLANTLVSGCSIQGRAFTTLEASDAALAICNLGLESGAAADDVLVTHDLVGVFQNGWAVLYERVSVSTALGLIEALKAIRVHDRDTRMGLSRLRVELTRQLKAGLPWKARGALEVIATLDLPAWAALRGLLDECPVMQLVIGPPGGGKPHAVSPTAFEFISGIAQIEAIHGFLALLPDALQS